MSVAEGRPGARRGAPSPAAAGRVPPWTRPGGVMLTVCLGVGGFALVSSAVILAAGPSNDTDWLLFLVALLALLPAALVTGRHLARELDAAGGSAAVSELAALAALGLLAILLISRLAHSLGAPSSALLLPLTVAWAIALALLARRAGAGDGASGALGAPGVRDAGRAWIIAGALACLCVLAFLSPELFRPVELGASLAIAAALTAVHAHPLHFGGGRLGSGRRIPLLIDAAVVALVITCVVDVSGYLEYLRPDARTVVLGDGLKLTPDFLAYAHRIHEGFWLGPLNDMLHGRALLVDTSSQYGVGVFYFLAAFFQIAPLGYGSLGLLAGFVTALQYGLAYGVMRLAGSPRSLAIPAVAAAVLGLVFGSIGSPDDFPSTGGLRFGIPWLVVALAVLAARWPGRRPALWAVATILVGVASVWSFETFAYTSATFVAVAAFDAATLEPGRRVRAFLRFILAAAGACVVAHLVLAIGTRAFAGSWPDWSAYLAFLKLYSIQELYFDVVDPWSPALPIILLHLASGVSLGALLARRHELVGERRPLLVGIAATAALGVASSSYFVGHSHPNTLIYTALPAAVEACLWITLAGDRLVLAPRAMKLAVVGAGFWIAALVAISGWPDATDKWQRTALAQAIPGQGDRLRATLPRLWRSPPSDPRAPEAQALLDRHLPEGQPALVITEPELSVETLVRSDRINVLPIGHPEQDNLVPEQADPKVRRAIDRLRPGTLMLTQPKAFAARVKGAAVPASLSNRGLVRIQRMALDRIRARFRLEEVERSPSGLAIVRLLPRR